MALTMEMLAQLPSITMPVTLVCAGNRRKEQNMHKQSIGFNWGPGGVSNAVWKGVLLRDLLLNICGGVKKGAKFVCFDGAEKLPNGTYGTSISVERALNPMNDVLIAYEMNGERLTPDHGYPVRLIVPGCIGGRMIKFLAKITVSEDRSDSWYHYHDNRVLPSMVMDNDMAEQEQWWYRPEYTINELNINSAICSPAHFSELPITKSKTINQEIIIHGYAYSGGCKKITRVEITLDSGQSWIISELDHPEERQEYQIANDHIHRQRYWCWCFWSVKVPVRKLLGCKDIHVRAWDCTQNTQPKDLNWNLMGMMNNCWYRVQVELAVCGADDGELVLRFIHPTVPGPDNGGGWMRPKGEVEMVVRDAPLSTTTTKPAPLMATTIAKRESVEKSKVESDKTDASLPKKPAPTTADTPPAGVHCFTAEMIAKHSTEDDCWITHSSKVYDCTQFLQEHPGGAESITMNAGEDCTEDFDAIHSVKAREMLEKYYIGDLVESMLQPTPQYTLSSAKVDAVVPIAVAAAAPIPSPLAPLTPTPSLLSSPTSADRSFVNPKKWQDVRLVDKFHLTHNTRLFRFALRYSDESLGLPLGKHLLLRVRTNDQMHIRAYTPTSLPSQCGQFDLVIKVYLKDTDPRFPAAGVVSQYLDNLAIGDAVAIQGPTGSFTYDGQGCYSHSSGRRGKALQIGMICGGTGLTPMYGIMQAILADRANDNTQVSLIFGNRTEDDILMRQEIEDTGNGLGLERFHLWHTLSESSPPDWKYGKGFINKDMIKEHLFPKGWCTPYTAEDMAKRIVLLCGPPPMINLCCIPFLTELFGKEFVDNNVFCF